MSHAFAKDSCACAACVSWGGERTMAADNTLVHVTRYSVEGECRTAVSQDYRKITKSYHTCSAWSPLPLLRAHGARPTRTPGHSAAMTAALASTPVAARPAAEPAMAAPAAAAGAAVTVAELVEPEGCRSTPLDMDKTPPAARVLYGYWRRLRGQRPMPLAREVDTAQIRECVSRLSLLAPVGDGRDFVYRACGRAVQRRLGMRPVSRLVSACHPADAAERWLADLRDCLKGRDALSLLVRDDPLLPGQRYVEVLLPLADEQGRPAFVLAYRQLPGG